MYDILKYKSVYAYCDELKIEENFFTCVFDGRNVKWLMDVCQ